MVTPPLLLYPDPAGPELIRTLDLSGQAGQQPFKNCRSPLRDARVLAWTSLPVGVVTLAERFDGRDVTEESFEAMVQHVMSKPPALAISWSTSHNFAICWIKNRTTADISGLDGLYCWGFYIILFRSPSICEWVCKSKV